MIWYILIIPMLLMQVYTFIYLRKVRRDDKALFKFCQARREIMSFLRTKEALELSQEDYIHTRHILGMTNHTIHHFNDLKPSFNLRLFLRSMRKINAQIKAEDRKVEVVTNPQVQALANSFVTCLIGAFFTYTPFLRHEIVITLAKQGANLLASLGVKRVKQWSQEMQDIARNLIDREHEAQNCFSA